MLRCEQLDPERHRSGLFRRIAVQIRVPPLKSVRRSVVGRSFVEGTR